MAAVPPAPLLQQQRARYGDFSRTAAATACPGSGASPKPARGFESLPREAMLRILEFLSPNEIVAKFGRLCNKCYEVSRDPELWERNLPQYYPTTDLIVLNPEPIAERRSKGRVQLGTFKGTGKTCVVRSVSLETTNAGKDDGVPTSCLREASLLHGLQNPYIVKCYSTSITGTEVKIVTEYIGPSLLMLLNANGPLEPFQIRSLMRQLLLGVNALHQRGIIHRNIRTENLVGAKTENDDFLLKICDLAMGRIVDFPFGMYTPEDPKERERSYREQRRLYNRAPELILRQPTYGLEVDMWSVGCVFMEIALGQAPFRCEAEIGLIFSTLQLCGTPDPVLWDRLSPDGEPFLNLPKWPPIDFRAVACVLADPTWRMQGAAAAPLEKHRETQADTINLLLKFGATVGAAGLQLLERLLILPGCFRVSADESLRFPYFTPGGREASADDHPSVVEWMVSWKREYQKELARAARRNENSIPSSPDEELSRRYQHYERFIVAARRSRNPEVIHIPSLGGSVSYASTFKAALKDMEMRSQRLPADYDLISLVPLDYSAELEKLRAAGNIVESSGLDCYSTAHLTVTPEPLTPVSHRSRRQNRRRRRESATSTELGSSGEFERSTPGGQSEPDDDEEEEEADEGEAYVGDHDGDSNDRDNSLACSDMAQMEPQAVSLNSAPTNDEPETVPRVMCPYRGEQGETADGVGRAGRPRSDSAARNSYSMSRPSAAEAVDVCMSNDLSLLSTDSFERQIPPLIRPFESQPVSGSGIQWSLSAPSASSATPTRTPPIFDEARAMPEAPSAETGGNNPLGEDCVSLRFANTTMRGAAVNTPSLDSSYSCSGNQTLLPTNTPLRGEASVAGPENQSTVDDIVGGIDNISSRIQTPYFADATPNVSEGSAAIGRSIARNWATVRPDEQGRIDSRVVATAPAGVELWCRAANRDTHPAEWCRGSVSGAATTDVINIGNTGIGGVVESGIRQTESMMSPWSNVWPATNPVEAMEAPQSRGTAAVPIGKADCEMQGEADLLPDAISTAADDTEDFERFGGGWEDVEFELDFPNPFDSRLLRSRWSTSFSTSALVNRRQHRSTSLGGNSFCLNQGPMLRSTTAEAVAGAHKNGSMMSATKRRLSICCPPRPRRASALSTADVNFSEFVKNSRKPTQQRSDSPTNTQRSMTDDPNLRPICPRTREDMFTTNGNARWGGGPADDAFMSSVEIALRRAARPQAALQWLVGSSRILRTAMPPFLSKVLSCFQSLTSAVMHPSQLPRVSPRSRLDIVNYLLGAQPEFMLKSQTLHIAVNYFDRYSALKLKGYPDDYSAASFIPTALACLKIADLYNEISKEYYKQDNIFEYSEFSATPPPSIEELVDAKKNKLGQTKVSAVELLEEEKRVVSALRFDVYVPTVCWFVDAYLSVSRLTHMTYLVDYCHYLADLGLHSHHLLAFRPALQAQVILLVGCCSLYRPIRALKGRVFGEVHTKDSCPQHSEFCATPARAESPQSTTVNPGADSGLQSAVSNTLRPPDPGYLQRLEILLNALVSRRDFFCQNNSAYETLDCIAIFRNLLLDGRRYFDALGLRNVERLHPWVSRLSIPTPAIPAYLAKCILPSSENGVLATLC